MNGLQTLLNAAKNLDGRRKAIVEEIAQLEREQHVGQPLSEAKSVLGILAIATGDHLRTLRLRLRSHIAHLLDSIAVKPEKHYGRVYVMAQLNFKGGMCKKVSFGPDFQSGQAE